MAVRGLTRNQWARIAAIAALVVGALAIIGIALRSGGTYEVVAEFDDVRGVLEGGQVTAGSLKVGTVEEVWLGEDGMPRVRMSVDNDFRLRQGAFANIKPVSNVGAVNRYVDLTQGDGPELPEGATLGPGQTDQPVDLDLAVSTLDPKTRADVAAVLVGVDRATKGRGSDIDELLKYSDQAFAETADLLAQVNYDRRALRRLVSEGRQVVGALATSPSDLGEAAERLGTVLRIAGARQVELGQTAARLGPGLREARLILERLSSSTGNLSNFVAELRPAVDQLVPLARITPPFVRALRPTVDEAQILISAAPRQVPLVGKVIRAALPVIRRLGPILKRLNPVLDHLRARAPEIVNFFTLLADATSNYDANGNLVRSTVPNIQFNRHPNPIGPSESVPGSVIRPFDRTPGSLEGEPWDDYYKSFIGGGKLPSSFLSRSAGSR